MKIIIFLEKLLENFLYSQSKVKKVDMQIPIYLDFKVKLSSKIELKHPIFPKIPVVLKNR